jgi:putative membrane protein insertion efficiency factor
VTWLLIAGIRGYQRFISPHLGDRCRYEPTCSQYAILSLRKYGLIRGASKAVEYADLR